MKVSKTERVSRLSKVDCCRDALCCKCYDAVFILLAFRESRWSEDQVSQSNVHSLNFQEWTWLYK